MELVPGRHVGPVKLMGGDRVASYAILWGSPAQPDQSPTKDFFSRRSDLALSGYRTTPMYFHHGLDKTMRADPQIGVWDRLEPDPVGLWAEGWLAKNHAYKEAIVALVKAGALSCSSESMPHLVVREPQPNGTSFIKRWPLSGISLTATPAEARLALGYDLSGLKAAFLAVGLNWPYREPVQSAGSGPHYGAAGVAALHSW
jgi:hypothetical protein